jgi:hypothetical protein
MVGWAVDRQRLVEAVRDPAPTSHGAAGCRGRGGSGERDTGSTGGASFGDCRWPLGVEIALPGETLP